MSAAGPGGARQQLDFDHVPTVGELIEAVPSTTGPTETYKVVSVTAGISADDEMNWLNETGLTVGLAKA